MTGVQTCALPICFPVTIMGGLGKLPIGEGVDVAKGMGEAMMYMSGGILAFAITIALVPKILGINKGAKEGEGGVLGTKRGWAEPLQVLRLYF